MSQICTLFGRGRHKTSTYRGHIQLSGELCVIRGKLADYIEDHAVLSPEGASLVTS